jgi:hypothetical protein
MISNIADGTGARILSNDEIDAVAGGCGACWAFLGAAAVLAGTATYLAVRDSGPAPAPAASTRGSYEPRGDTQAVVDHIE